MAMNRPTDQDGQLSQKTVKKRKKRWITLRTCNSVEPGHMVTRSRDS